MTDSETALSSPVASLLSYINRYKDRMEPDANGGQTLHLAGRTSTTEVHFYYTRPDRFDGLHREVCGAKLDYRPSGGKLPFERIVFERRIPLQEPGLTGQGVRVQSLEPEQTNVEIVAGGHSYRYEEFDDSGERVKRWVNSAEEKGPISNLTVVDMSHGGGSLGFELEGQRVTVNLGITPMVFQKEETETPGEYSKSPLNYMITVGEKKVATSGSRFSKR